MKRLLILALLLCSTPILAATPEDAVYVFMRSFVSIDGKGVCDSDEPWRVQIRLDRAPAEVWALSSQLDTLRPRMIGALTPLIRDCQKTDWLRTLTTKGARNQQLALCVATHPMLIDFLQVGGVLDDLNAILGTKAATHTGLRCNGDPCPNGTICDCRKSNPLDLEADCEKVAASCEHSEEPVRQIGGLTLSITW